MYAIFEFSWEEGMDYLAHSVGFVLVQDFVSHCEEEDKSMGPK